MTSHRFRSPSYIVVWALVLFTAAVTVRGLWHGTDGNGWKETIRSDARGYYGYLQATFLRHDLGHEAFNHTYVKYTPTGTLNKYFCGTSLMMMPWFGIGHALAIQDPDAVQDGTSSYEQKAIGVGAWLYLLLGLLALRALLLGLGVREPVVAWTLVALGIGTPLLQYAAMQPGWSHIFSFCVVSGFLWAVQRLGRNITWGAALLAALCLGLVVLIRPVNAMILLAVPIVLGRDTWAVLGRLIQRPKVLFGSALVCLLVVGIQPLLWYVQTGNWVEYGYQGEGFHWDRPEVIKVLFGFRRGLFLWTPLMLLVALGAVLVWRIDRMRSAWTIGYWVVSTYIISSWWIWYYGGGYASRVHIDHYPVLVIPMALMLHRWKNPWWFLARMFMVCCIALNLAQLWQYHHGFLHAESMDREKYSYSFLRFDEAHRDRLGGNYQEAPYNPNGMDVVLTESCDLDSPCLFWNSGVLRELEGAYSGPKVCVYAPGIEFGTTFYATTDTLPTGRALYLEVGLQRMDVFPESSRYALGVTEVRHADGTQYLYEPFRLNPVPGIPGVWQQLEFRIPVPPLEVGDALTFYLWNKDGRSSFLIDAVFMRISAVRPY
ncbi:MAG: hypothetical protein IPH05_00300 [Flavobacteriales bacterium]|jgi:hypothetical protein|nr:hypothetical protein [Flavobacteriales bacterium]MBK7102704.1 hypothetical protein [Flavobacteriales bacterium]MBK8710238.1 hypothetical protein [Flavobacteriales bacterium]MBP9178682.1 hypothetical protein [Flavobacteriales bacterium]